MWDVPLYRIRAYVRNRKKSRQSSGLLDKARLELHLRRSDAQLTLTDGLGLERKTLRASVVLNDISPRGLFLFTGSNLAIGQKVSLFIQHPTSFYVQGRVVVCKRLSMRNNVISSTSYPYRVGILFEFRSIDERIAIKKYCDELAQRWLKLQSVAS